VLIGVVIFYERRWRRTRTLIRDLEDSVESGQQLLLDSERRLASQLGLDRFMRSLRLMMEERSRVRARNASQMEQIETTFRNMREGVLLIDPEDRVVVSNRSADKLLNRGESLVGQRLAKLIHHPVFLDFAQQLRRTGVHGRHQVRIDLLGQTVWLEISGAAMEPPGVDPKQRLSLFLINDITQLKKLEGIRKDFAANVSHELRTPITIIKGFVETLYENGDRLTEAQRQSFTEKVYRNTERLHLLVEDLLSLSRLESKSLELKREECCLQDEIRSFLKNYNVDESSAAELTHSFPAEPICVELDRLFFERILTNLVDNAFKHGKPDSVVEIILRQNEENGWAEVVVSDDGIGIPELARERIFQRFYRVDIGHSRQTGGTGLGLSIVRHAMLAHGGHVRVESRQPKGTHFVCVFPRRTHTVEAG